MYRGADNSLARQGMKQARKHVRDARDFNNIETRAVIKFFFFFYLQGKAPKEIQAILTEILACFLPGQTKDLSAPLYFNHGRSSSSELASFFREAALPCQTVWAIKCNAFPVLSIISAIIALYRILKVSRELK